jgi:hypothetical protein
VTFVLACKVVVLLGPLKPIHMVHSEKKNEERKTSTRKSTSQNTVCAQYVERR